MADEKRSSGIPVANQNSLVGILPLDVMAGPSMIDEYEGSATDNSNTIMSSGVNMIDTVVLDQSDIGKKK